MKECKHPKSKRDLIYIEATGQYYAKCHKCGFIGPAKDTKSSAYLTFYYHRGKLKSPGLYLTTCRHRESA